jgi:hypothetical protein
MAIKIVSIQIVKRNLHLNQSPTVSQWAEFPLISRKPKFPKKSEFRDSTQFGTGPLIEIKAQSGQIPVTDHRWIRSNAFG